jgi:hypothetical protein
MKSFVEYLNESAKQYMFRVRLACDCDQSLIAKLKAALEKYGVDDVSEPKRLPITQKAYGFDHLDNPEIHVVDVVTNYPCTPQQLSAVLNEIGIPASMAMVTTPNQEVIISPMASEAGEGKAILDKDLPKSTYPQVLADLEQALTKREPGKYQYTYAAKDKTSTGQTTNDIPQGKASPVGSKQNKIPNPYKLQGI